MRKFLGSAAGIIVMTVVFTAIFFGIIIALSNVSEGLGAIVILVCAVNGWRILDRIQPEMFLWMSWVGWLIYFLVKLMIAVVIGVFATAYYLGKAVSGLICGSFGVQ